MKKVLLFGVVLLVAACSSKSNPLGSDNFVPIQHENQIYVLNSRTGEMFRVKEGQRYRVVQYDKEIEEIIKELTDVQNPVEFNLTVGVKDIVQFDGMAKIVAEQPKIRGSIEPYSDALHDFSGSWFRLSFRDADDFDIGSVDVSKSDMTRLFDEGRYIGWNLQKDLDMTTDQYRSVETVKVGWSPGLDASIESWLETEDGREWEARHSLDNQEKVGPDGEVSTGTE